MKNEGMVAMIYSKTILMNILFAHISDYFFTIPEIAGIFISL